RAPRAARPDPGRVRGVRRRAGVTGRRGLADRQPRAGPRRALRLRSRPEPRLRRPDAPAAPDRGNTARGPDPQPAVGRRGTEGQETSAAAPTGVAAARSALLRSG